MALDPGRLYARACSEAHRDGTLSDSERRLLHRLRDWLLIPAGPARELEERIRTELAGGPPSGGELDPEEFLRAVLREDLEGKRPGEADRILLEQLVAYLEIPLPRLEEILAEILEENPASLEEKVTELATLDLTSLVAGSTVNAALLSGAAVASLAGGGQALYASYRTLIHRPLWGGAWFGGLAAVVVALLLVGVRADPLAGHCWKRPLQRQLLGWSLIFGCLSAFTWSVVGLATASVPLGGRLLVCLVGVPLAAYLFLVPARGAYLLALSRHSGGRFSSALGIWEMLFEFLTEAED